MNVMYLKLDLQYFASDGEGQGEQKEIMIPLSRFEEVQSKHDAIKAELEAFQAAAQGEQQDGQPNEYEAELEELKAQSQAANTRIEEIESTISKTIESKLANIDENFHSLIPQNVSPIEQLSWIMTAEERGIFGVAKRESIPLGNQTNPKLNTDALESSLNPLEMITAAYNRR